MKTWKQRLIALTLSVLLAVTASAPIWAEEVDAVPTEAEALDAEHAQGLIDAVVRQLGVYVRYEDVTERSLYRAAIEKVVRENPELYGLVLKGMLESIDPYSEYYTAEEGESLMTSVSGIITGIGVTIDFSAGSSAVIASVIPDTPAERAGLQVGDVIVAADGFDLRGAKSEIVLSHVRGEEGTTVRLEVERGGAVLSFEMPREKIIGTSVTKEVAEDSGKKLMYIRIHGFVSNTAEKFSEALQEADRQGIRNLVLDLRDNGGGLLDQAVTMAEYFVPEGKPITTADFKLKPFNETYFGHANAEQKYDTVILINENTASASEVFTAALRENERAVTLGQNSYGKGTIQSINELSDGGLIKYTTGFYLTPNGNNINGIGIAPDIAVQNAFHKADPSEFEDFAYTQIYEEGASGKDVKTAKELLSFYGLYRGEINETFDAALVGAVYNFQAAMNLYPYGCLDLTTQIQMRNYLSQVQIEEDTQKQEAFAYFGMHPAEAE